MISRFVQRYGVDMSEAEQEDALAYDCFNDFFTRALKDGARPLDDEPGSVLCPADGAISQMGAIEHGRIFQAKGHSYGLADLLGGDATRAAPFQGGEFATIHLSPRDYHPVRLVGGTRNGPSRAGRLFSVNPLTARNVPRLFARNERVVCIFDTEHGPMALVLVGAMIVASIETVWAGLVTPHKRGVKATRYDADARAHPPGQGAPRWEPLQAQVHRHRAVRSGQDPLVRHALGARPGPMGELLALPA